MVLVPSSDRDNEAVSGEKLQIATIAPNVPIADRRLNIAVDCRLDCSIVELSMLVSVG
jgi:hypothetical protein